MHRTTTVPRLLGWTSLLVSLMLGAGTPAAVAQDKEIPSITMPTGGIQFYQMLSKENLKEVINPDAKVIKVHRVIDKFDQVLIEALAPGKSTLTFVDVKANKEQLLVIVISDRVKQLRELIQRAVPGNAVTVIASDIGNSVVLSGTVKSVEDARTIQQIAAQLFGVNVINNIQIGGVQQVQLEILIATVNRSCLRTMSFSWMENQQSWFLSSILGGPFTLTSFIQTAASGGNSTLIGPTGANLPFGVMTNKTSFLGFLQALRTEGLTKTLAEPRVTTLSGRPANIVSGGEVPILTSSGIGAPSVSYKQFGTVVTFLPIVLGNGKIHLEVRPELSIPDAALGISIAGTNPTSITGFKTQSAQVAVQIEDGQTLAIGGLIQNDVTSTISRVPVLGELPFISFLFTTKSYQETEQELIILVTPRLVDPIDCTKIPHFLPGRETRNPDDFELFAEGIMEAPRGQRNVPVHPFQYKAAYLSGPTFGYPCNDATGCAGRGNCGGNCGGGGCANGACGMPVGSSVAPTSATMPAAPLPDGPRIVRVPSVPAPAPAPVVMPPQRDMPAGLTPPVPPSQPAPVGELENRIVLPPVSFGPNGPR